LLTSGHLLPNFASRLLTFAHLADKAALLTFRTETDSVQIKIQVKQPAVTRTPASSAAKDIPQEAPVNKDKFAR
jgi:hypothetical protein